MNIVDKINKILLENDNKFLSFLLNFSKKSVRNWSVSDSEEMKQAVKNKDIKTIIDLLPIDGERILNDINRWKNKFIRIKRREPTEDETWEFIVSSLNSSKKIERYS